MPKYTMLWETKSGDEPFDFNERREGHLKLIEMVKQVLKDNPGVDFGLFISEHQGYVTGIKSWQEVVKIDQMFSPFVKFKVYQTLSVAEDEEVWKSAGK